MLREKMTLRELLQSGLISSGTEYELMGCNDPIYFDPDDSILFAAFSDFVVDSITASGDGKMRIFFSLTPEIRRQPV